MRAALAPAALLLVGALAGCVIGDIKTTTTPRAAKEMFLLSTAAERAIAHVDSSKLANKRVWIDVSKLGSIDQPYVESALRNFVAQGNGRLVPGKDRADVVVEVRAGSLGLWDGDWGVGIPLPIGPVINPNAPTSLSIDYTLHEGWAHFQVWAYDAKTDAFVGSWHDCWGRSYIGFFDDIYPSSGVGDTLTSYTK